MDTYDVQDFLERWGYRVGLVVILLPLFYDIVFHGLLSDIKICGWGVVCMLLGVGVIVVTRIVKKFWEA